MLLLFKVKKILWYISLTFFWIYKCKLISKYKGRWKNPNLDYVVLVGACIDSGATFFKFGYPCYIMKRHYYNPFYQYFRSKEPFLFISDSFYHCLWITSLEFPLKLVDELKIRKPEICIKKFSELSSMYFKLIGSIFSSHFFSFLFTAKRFYSDLDT